MPVTTRPSANFTPEQLCFNSIPGFTVRADFAGGELSSDFGAAILNAVDHRIDLIDRLTAAISDPRDARYITHPLQDFLRQRVFQIVSGYEDGNDADTLHADPLFKLAAGRAPLETDNSLACGATHSCLEGSLRRNDIYRTAKALIEQFVTTYSEGPSSITLDIDHTDDATHGQQEFTFYNHHSGRYCYLPLLPNPELMKLISEIGNADFPFGLGGNAVLSIKEEGLMKNVRGHLASHQSMAAQGIGPVVSSVHLFGEFDYSAKSWPQAHRVALKAEVLAENNGLPARTSEELDKKITTRFSP